MRLAHPSGHSRQKVGEGNGEEHRDSKMNNKKGPDICLARNEIIEDYSKMQAARSGFEQHNVGIYVAS